MVAPKKNLIGQLNNIKIKTGIGKGIRNLNCRSHDHPKENQKSNNYISNLTKDTRQSSNGASKPKVNVHNFKNEN